MHMNIYVFFQNLNILCSFWSTIFFFFFFFLSGPVSHFWGQPVRSVSSSDNIAVKVKFDNDITTKGTLRWGTIN
jgi:hypothetical protein